MDLEISTEHEHLNSRSTLVTELSKNGLQEVTPNFDVLNRVYSRLVSLLSLQDTVSYASELLLCLFMDLEDLSAGCILHSVGPGCRLIET
jgi:hypothetical protein